MRKIKLIVKLLPLLILFFFFAQTSFAQNANGSFFDSKVVFSQRVNPNSQQAFIIGPFTSIIIQPKTFKEEVSLYVYEGNFDKIKAALPPSQSPISSYYLNFLNSKNQTITPELPIIIHSYNNYINSKTYFYPLTSTNQININSVKEMAGPIRVNEQLPVKDIAFIVAVNKILNKNDSSLLPATSEKDAQTAPKAKTQYNSLILPFGLLGIVLLTLIVVLFLSFRKRNKKS